MKLRFSIRRLLTVFVVFAVLLTIVVKPRFERQQTLNRLREEAAVASLQTDAADFCDRLLRVEGPIGTIRLGGRDNTLLLSKSVVEAVATASSLTDLIIDNVK